ncbi:MAG: enoyl-CoA hydratase [Actinomycetota bacterium]|jgi:enoyl-CoA hydratase|nr:enoyl-CoA hydratase [Actinomycetota bacterium]
MTQDQIAMPAVVEDMIDITIDAHVATVLLSRPPVNACNAELFLALRRTFDRVGVDRDVRAVVFGSSIDGIFCGGVDVKSGWRLPDAPRPIDPGELIRDAFEAVEDCAVPVVAAIDGPALGAGVALAASCDIIVASERAVFGCPEIDLGLLGGASHLGRLIGRHRMRELYFTARRVPAGEFAVMGGVTRLVATGAALTEARMIADEIARKSPVAIRLGKEALNRVENLPVRDGYRTEQDYTTRLLAFDDSKEALRAWRERRDPTFTGQ